MKKILMILFLNFFLVGYSEVSADMRKFGEKYTEYLLERQKKQNLKSPSCKKKIKDIKGFKAVEAYNKCMKIE